MALKKKDKAIVGDDWLRPEEMKIKEEKSLDDKIKSLTEDMNKFSKSSLVIGSNERKEFLRKVSEWSNLVKDEKFTENMFIQYQNYIGNNPEIILDFLETHKVTEEFMERFFLAKKWGIHPAYILKYQPHLTNFIKKYKDYFNQEDYENIINPKD